MTRAEFFISVLLVGVTGAIVAWLYILFSG